MSQNKARNDSTFGGKIIRMVLVICSKINYCHVINFRTET